MALAALFSGAWWAPRRFFSPDTALSRPPLLYTSLFYIKYMDSPDCSPFGSKNGIWDYKTCGDDVHSAVQNELITNSRRNSRRRREFNLKFGLKRHEFQAKLQAAPRI